MRTAGYIQYKTENALVSAVFEPYNETKIRYTLKKEIMGGNCCD